MALTPEQLEARLSGVGASECAALLGLTKFQSAYGLWAIKTRLLDDDFEGNDLTRAGVAQEPVTADWFARTTGARILTVGEWAGSEIAAARFPEGTLEEARRLQMLRHPKYPFCIASPDRIALFSNLTAAVELKFSAATNADMWGDTGTDDIPTAYMIQVQWQLFVTGLKIGYLAVSIGAVDYRWFRIDRDDALIRMIFDKVYTFWHDYVLPRRAPEHSPADRAWGRTLEKVFPRADKSRVIELPSDDPMIAEVIAATEAKAAAEARLEVLRAKLKERIGGAYKIAGPWGAIRWQNERGRKSVDHAAIYAEAGIPAALIAKHTKTGEDGRKLVIALNGADDNE